MLRWKTIRRARREAGHCLSERRHVKNGGPLAAAAVRKFNRAVRHVWRAALRAGYADEA